MGRLTRRTQAPPGKRPGNQGERRPTAGAPLLLTLSPSRPPALSPPHLKLHQHVRLPRRERGHDLRHERVKLGARSAAAAEAAVAGVVEEGFVVCADVDADGEALARVEAWGV